MSNVDLYIHPFLLGPGKTDVSELSISVEQDQPQSIHHYNHIIAQDEYIPQDHEEYPLPTHRAPSQASDIPNKPLTLSSPENPHQILYLFHLPQIHIIVQ
jgi:hypothetical protein